MLSLIFGPGRMDQSGPSSRVRSGAREGQYCSQQLPHNSLTQILCLREFMYNQPLLNRVLFWDWAGGILPRTIDWLYTWIGGITGYFHFICCFNRVASIRESLGAIFKNLALFIESRAFLILNSKFQIFFSHRNPQASGFVDVRRPRIKCDWTLVHFLRRVAVVRRATGGSSAAGLEGGNLNETLRLPVTGNRPTRVTC